MADFDAVIIGAGIAGVSLAYELAPSLSVALVERESFGGTHSTGRSAALFIYPYGTATMSNLARLSLPFLLQPPQDFAEASFLTARPLLWLARHDQISALETHLVHSRALGVELTELEIGDAIARWPILSSDYLKGGRAALDESAYDIDVHALHSAYLRGFKDRGGTYLTSSEALGLNLLCGDWIVRTAEQELSAKVVVNAAGAWADEVAELAGVEPARLDVTRRTMVMLPPMALEMADWPCFVDVAEQFYFKPEGKSLLVSPADEGQDRPCDAQPDELDVALAVDRLERATKLRVRTVAQCWAGLRTFAADRDPVIGWDDAAPGFFWLAGQGGAGIMTSPAIARFAASLMTGSALPEDVAASGLCPSNVSPARLRTTGPEHQRNKRIPNP